MDGQMGCDVWYGQVPWVGLAIWLRWVRWEAIWDGMWYIEMCGLVGCGMLIQLGWMGFARCLNERDEQMAGYWVGCWVNGW
jgi:hypothetical protein